MVPVHLDYLPKIKGTPVLNIGRHPKPIICLSLEKYSTNPLVLEIPLEICGQASKAWFNYLKTCRYPTDRLMITISNFLSMQLDRNPICNCLLNPNFDIIENRGIIFKNSFDEVIGYTSVKDVCKMPNWIRTGRLGSPMRQPPEATFTSLPGSVYIVADPSYPKYRSWAWFQNNSENTQSFGKTSQYALLLPEQLALVLICEKLELQCHTVQSAEVLTHGAERNGSWTGLMGLIQSLNVHIGISVRRDYDSPWEVEFTPTFYFDHFSFVVKLRYPEYHQSPTLTNIFGPIVWICILLESIFIAIVLYGLGRVGRRIGLAKSGSPSFQKLLLNVVGSLSESSGLPVKGGSSMVMAASWWCFVIVVLTAFKSKLLVVLLQPLVPNNPTTYKELINEEFGFGVYHRELLKEAWARFENSSIIPGSKSAQNCFEATLLEDFACAGINKFNKLFATQVLSYLGFRAARIDHVWYFSKNEEKPIQFAWSYHRGFPMKRKLNDAIGRMSQGGFADKLYSVSEQKSKHTERSAGTSGKYTFQQVYMETMNTLYRKELAQHVQLRVQHFVQIFYLLCIGFGIAVYVFILEFLVSIVKRMSSSCNNGCRY